MRGVKGTGPNGVKEESSERIMLKMITLHETVTWPGVPKVADNTLTEGKVPGLKMYLSDDEHGHQWLFMEVPGHKCRIPVTNIRICFEE